MPVSLSPTGQVRKTLDEGRALLDKLDVMDTSCHSVYYKTAMEYYMVVGPSESFYANSITYLSYTNVEAMDKEERYKLATSLSLSALTGKAIYNFGEVLFTPLLQASLPNTPNSWILDLIVAFSEGDVTGYHKILASKNSEIQACKELASSFDVLEEKIRLLSVVNLVFKRDANNRTIPFAEISAIAQIPSDQTEWLLMRALSLSLIKGEIDEIEQVVEVSWVLPRVLGMEQIKEMASRLKEWEVKVEEMGKVMHEGGGELLA